jgi:hypothetical protein
MGGLGLSTLPIATEAWSFALGALAILIPSITAAYVGWLRYKVLIERDRTDRFCRMAEQANRTFELSLQDKASELATLLLETWRADIAFRTKLALDAEAATAGEATPTKKAA